jgi:hypothetical protein
MLLAVVEFAAFGLSPAHHSLRFGRIKPNIDIKAIPVIILTFS